MQSVGKDYIHYVGIVMIIYIIKLYSIIFKKHRNKIYLKVNIFKNIEVSFMIL